MMTIGSDLHTRYQQIAMLDTNTGEMLECRLERASGEARAFYAAPQGPVRVGIEATGYTHWFEAVLAELGHELWMGDAAKIRGGVAHPLSRSAPCFGPLLVTLTTCPIAPATSEQGNSLGTAVLLFDCLR